MWFLSKRNVPLTRRAVTEAEPRPYRLVPATMKKIGGRRPLVLEVLEDRLAPATLVQTLYPPDDTASQTGGSFGAATATDSNYHIVSMPSANIGGVQHRGAAYVYSATTGSLIATLVNHSPTSDDSFGGWMSMSLSGNKVVVGAYNFDDAGATDSGRAYVFDAPTGALIATLANPSPANTDLFGWSVSVSGNTAVVGARFDDTRATDSGQAYVFDATTGALITTMYNPSPASADSFGDGFGAHLSVSGNTVAVGANGDDTAGKDSGKAYLFNATTGALIATMYNPSPASADSFGDGFGAHLSVSGNTVVVGATGEDAGALNIGQAYIFNATTGALIVTLANPSPASNDSFCDFFGGRVAVSGNTAVVGADNDDSGVADSGQAYVFDVTTGALIATLVNPSPASGDQFSRVSVFGNRVFVGATRDDTQDVNQGAAYVFSLDSGEVSQPVVTSVGPAAGPTTGGTTAVINGANFLGVTGPAGVTFGPNNATFYSVDSDTRITAIVPAGSGLVNITITNTAFTSPTAGTADDFRYTSAAPAVRFILSGPTSIAANTSFSVTVTALDANGNIATSYTGTVRFSDSGKGAALPANFKFTAIDKGVHTFTGIKLKQAGQHTLTVVDTLANTVVGTLSVNVV